MQGLCRDLRQPVRRSLHRSRIYLIEQLSGGRAAYDEFRRQLLDEINSLLEAEGLPHALALYELPGQYVNLEYPTPGGERVRLLSDNDIYLGTQIEFADLGICYGVIADTGFILICSYSRDGSDPEIVVFKRR